MVFGIANNLNATTAGDHDIALRNAFRGVVGAFGMYIGPQQADQLLYIRGIENSHRVHIFQRCQNFSPFLFRDTRTAFPFELAHAGIRIDRDNQLSAKIFCRAKIADMSDMQQIKAAIGEDNLIA